MAKRISRATGIWTDNNTWGLIDTGSFANTEATSFVLTTTYASSSTFTLAGPTTIDGHAVKLSVRSNTLGTMTTGIDSASVDVPGTIVAVSASDLPAAATADLNGGWIFFKYATPVTLSGSGVYSIKAKTSNASQISLFVSAGNNFDRLLSTTTTGTPVAGDDVIIAGEYTGVGTSNNIVVTMDNSGSTIFGSATASLLSPAIAVCSKGFLRYDTGSAKSPTLKLSGSLIVYTGGEFSMGLSGSEIPRNSTASLQFLPTTNVDYGLTVRNLGTYNAAGLSRTVGKEVGWCFLTTDLLKSGSVCNVDRDTGWLDGDQIAIATTSQTAAQCETASLSGNAGATSFTITGGGGPTGSVVFTHSGSVPLIAAEIILLNRNVKVYGSSSTRQAYVNIKATATASMKWAEYYWLGSATANKRGIDIATSTGGVLNMVSCSFHDFAVASSRGLNLAANINGTVNLLSNTGYNINDYLISLVLMNGIVTVDSNILMRSNNANIINLGDIGSIITNNVVIGGQVGINVSENAATIGTISGNRAHGNSVGLAIGSTTNGGLILNQTSYRNSQGIACNTAPSFINDIIISGSNLFGNVSNYIQAASSCGNITFISCSFNSDIAFPSQAILLSNPSISKLNFINCDFGTVGTFKSGSSAEFSISGLGTNCSVTVVNSIMTSPTIVATQTNMTSGSFIAIQKFNKIAGNHKTFKRFGTLFIESGSVHTGTKSLKMVPNDISCSLESSGQFGGFKIAVASGSTGYFSIYALKDSIYNGIQPKLILKRNDAVGISADQLIDTYTAGTGSWNMMSGSSPAVNDDGVLEFVVAITGTSGSVFLDSAATT